MIVRIRVYEYIKPGDYICDILGEVDVVHGIYELELEGRGYYTEEVYDTHEHPLGNIFDTSR